MGAGASDGGGPCGDKRLKRVDGTNITFGSVGDDKRDKTYTFPTYVVPPDANQE